MTARKNAILLLIAVVLGAGVWLSERASPVSGGRPQSGIGVLHGISPSSISEIAVVTAEDKFRLMRAGPAGWQLAEPAGAPASREAVDAILQAITEIQADNIIEADEMHDESAYGLTPPELVLTIKGGFGRRALSFGKKNKLTMRRYLQPEADDRLYLVPEQTFTLLNKHTADLRERAPLRFSPDTVSGISVLRRGLAPLVFQKENGAGRWYVSSKERRAAADPQVVRRQLERLAGIRARNFIDDPESAPNLYGLQQPEFIIGLEIAAQPDGSAPARQLTVNIGRGVAIKARGTGDSSLGLGASYYLRILGEPAAYEVDRPFFGELFQTFDFFRLRTPNSWWQPKDITAVTFDVQNSSGRLHLELHRSISGAWTAAAGAVTGQEVDNWLEQLQRLRVLSYVGGAADDQPELGLKDPQLRAVLQQSSGRSSVFRIGSAVTALKQESAGNHTAPSFAAASAEDGEELSAVIAGPDAEALRSASFFKPPPGAGADRK